ncbi:TetR/AcrR family transcriptional regulator C-terminal domain-containing protein [Sphaerisporangium fuscum]|uniref:TetR/AcrR family transcriptional regulator C-terminal domain-containing protein n=1 Tax=Sphaerisporangium fuscum TaxID=2835868 RepID=UPI001BDC02D3|nr:TetR/AcrR family transcriptional regulator C-terminal domain-containing protein [Sphaerisporangium fuscum]
MAAVDDYVLGYVTREIRESEAPRREGLTQAERTAMLQPYLSDLVGSGDFPNLAPLLKDGLPVVEDNFERGLKWLFDGIAAELSLP